MNKIKLTHEKWVAPASVHSIKKMLSVFLSNLSRGCTHSGFRQNVISVGNGLQFPL